MTSHDVEDGVTSCDFEEEGIYYHSLENTPEHEVNVRMDLSPEWSYDNFGAWKSETKQVKGNVYDELIKAAVDHGFMGACGKNFSDVPKGDTFWCDDRQEGLRTNCIAVSAHEYLCCTDKNGCDDKDDFKVWRV